MNQTTSAMWATRTLPLPTAMQRGQPELRLSGLTFRTALLHWLVWAGFGFVNTMAHATSPAIISLPMPGSRTTTQHNLTVYCETQGAGYREFQIVLNLFPPAAEERQVTFKISSASSYAGPREVAKLGATQTFKIPAQATQFTAEILVPSTEVSYVYSLETSLDGKRVSDLCFGNFSTGMDNELTARFKFIGDKYPAWDAVTELLTHADLGANSWFGQPQPVVETALLDGTPTSAWQYANGQLKATKTITRAPSMQLVPLAKAPTNWQQYSATDIVVLSLPDLQNLATNRPAAAEALRRWVWGGGNLILTHAQDLTTSRMEAETLLRGKAPPDEASQEVEWISNPSSGLPNHWVGYMGQEVVLSIDLRGGRIQVAPTQELIEVSNRQQIYHRTLNSPGNRLPQGIKVPRGFTVTGQVIYQNGYNMPANPYGGYPSASPGGYPGGGYGNPSPGYPNPGDPSAETFVTEEDAGFVEETGDASTEAPATDDAASSSESMDLDEEPATSESPENGVDAEAIENSDQESPNPNASLQPAVGPTAVVTNTVPPQAGPVVRGYQPVVLQTGPPSPSPTGRVIDRFIARRCGAGRVLLIQGDPYPGNHAEWLTYLAVLGSERINSVHRQGFSVLRGVDDFWDYMVPGVGLAPVAAFRILITLFAVLIGPVNFFLLRRLHKVQLLLLTVPVSAALITGSLFAWAYLADGLHTRAKAVSLTLLNQRTGDAACFSRLTYYAGSTPWNGLAFSKDTLVLPMMSQNTGGLAATNQGRWVEWGAEQQQLSSAWLPARTPTQIHTQRLRNSAARLAVSETGQAVSVANGLGTTIHELILVDSNRSIYFGDKLQPKATQTLTSIDGAEAMVKAQRWLSQRELVNDFYSPTGGNGSSFSWSRMLIGQYQYVSPTAGSWQVGSMETANLGIANGNASQWGPRTYAALVETSPDFQPGLSGARWEQQFHLVIGTY